MVAVLYSWVVPDKDGKETVINSQTWCLEGKGIDNHDRVQGIAGKQNREVFHFEKVDTTHCVLQKYKSKKVTNYQRISALFFD